MKKWFIKYPAFVFVFVAAISYVHPLAGQEGGFNFRGAESQEEFHPAHTGIPLRPENQYLNDQDNNGGSSSGQGSNSNQEKTTKKAVERSEAESKEQEQQNSGNGVENSANEENSGSVLSFNFLHYIIHKFKFSDVIGQ